MDVSPRNCGLGSSSCKEARPIPHRVDVGEVRRELGGNLDHPHTGQIRQGMERSLAARRLGLEQRARGRHSRSRAGGGLDRGREATRRDLRRERGREASPWPAIAGAGRSQALTIQVDSGSASKQASERSERAGDAGTVGEPPPGRLEFPRPVGDRIFTLATDLRVSTRPRRARTPTGQGLRRRSGPSAFPPTSRWALDRPIRRLAPPIRTAPRIGARSRPVGADVPVVVTVRQSRGVG